MKNKAGSRMIQTVTACNIQNLRNLKNDSLTPSNLLSFFIFPIRIKRNIPNLSPQTMTINATIRLAVEKEFTRAKRMRTMKDRE